MAWNRPTTNNGNLVREAGNATQPKYEAQSKKYLDAK